MRILVTGANGQLGRELGRVALASGHESLGMNRGDCDITDPVAVARTLDNVSPDVVINCAAWTRVDAAETETDEAYRANALGPRLLATACSRRDILLVHISTDYVFGGGGDSPIDEWQDPSPRSVYGASKLAGENEVRHLCRRHQVVRTSWLYGCDGPNFILTIRRAAAAGRHLRVVSDQVGSPTWTGHLAPALLRLIALDQPGTYHLTNSGTVSWHELAQTVVSSGGFEVPVDPISTDEYPTAAPRPAYSVLDNRAWRLLGEEPLPHWSDGLASYLDTLAGVEPPPPE